MHIKHIIALRTCQLLFLFASTFAYAADTESNDVENQVKATYLYKFATYVEWPTTEAAPNVPFTIGVIGSDEIAADLKNLVNGHLINNRAVEVVPLKPNAPNAAAPTVQILFVGKQGSAAAQKSILKAVQSQPVLTVTETPDGLEDGSIINLLNDDNHVRFEVSLTQAERSGLKISARLLKVAKKVETKK
jgi:hypothetical protein